MVGPWSGLTWALTRTANFRQDWVEMHAPAPSTSTALGRASGSPLPGRVGAPRRSGTSGPRLVGLVVSLLLWLLAAGCARDYVPPLSPLEPAHPQAVSTPVPPPSTRLEILAPVTLQELPPVRSHDGHAGNQAPPAGPPVMKEHDHAHH